MGVPGLALRSEQLSAGLSWKRGRTSWVEILAWTGAQMDGVVWESGPGVGRIGTFPGHQGLLATPCRSHVLPSQ